MKLTTFSKILVPIWMVLALAACGGGGGGGGNEPEPENQAPRVTSTSFELDQDAELTATLTATDPESDAVIFTKKSEPAHGKLVSFAASGAFTYRPDAGFSGADSFRVSASDGTNSVTATIALNVKDVQDEQTLTFTLPGPLSLIIGDTLSNPASAPGSGAVTYSSSDPAVATVDGTGLVTAIAEGTVEIRADKAADEANLAAQASYTLSVETGVAFTAWLGTSDTQVNFPAIAEGMEFYRSSAPGCDLANYASCPDGQLDILGVEPVTDTAAMLSRPGYYTLQYGELVASLSVNADAAVARFSERRNQQVVVFQGQQWLIGGSDDQGKTNDVWSSRDGLQWARQTKAAAFSARSHHRVVAFKDQLWLIGGDDGSRKNDVWSSSDGIHWTQKTAGAAFSARADHEVTVFDGQLWLVGGDDGNRKNDVWSSSDGINWSQQETVGEVFSARSNHQVVVYADQLWLIGGDDGSDRNDVWSSSDGITWEQRETVGDVFTARSGHRVVVYDDQLWLIGGDDGNHKNDVWSSSDGINWTEKTASAAFPASGAHQAVAFEEKLWLIGGGDGDRGNDVWRSVDGVDWRLGQRHKFDFTVCGGDIESCNGAPTVTSTDFELDQDTDLTETLTATDPENDTLTFAKASDPAHGQLIAFEANGAFTYRPDTGFVGADSFQVTAFDGTQSVTATITLSVQRVNHAPTVTSTSFELDQDTSFSETLTATDPENDTVTFNKASDPAHGQLVTFEESGAFTYRPDDGFVGTDSFEVTASDGTDSVTVTVGLTVRHVNAVPTVTSTSFELDHDTDLVETLTATDPENDEVTFAQSSDPAHGEIIAFAANGAFTYRPDAGFGGADSFKVTASDGTDSVTATIALDVRATSQTLSFVQPGPLTLTAGNITSNPANGPGSGLVTYSSSNPSIATVNSAGLVTGVAPGIVVIRAEKAADDLYLAAEASYTLTVERANTVPTVTSTSFELDHDTDLVETLTAIDPENDTVTFAQSSEPAHGQLVTFEANGVFTYRPDAGFAGSDSFKVTASDGFDSVTATIALEVRATSQALSFDQPGPQSLTVGGILSNPATGPGSGLVTYSSSNPSVATVNSAGLVTAFAEGTAEIRAEKAADDLYLAAEASYTLTVARANTAPTVTSTSFELDHSTDLVETLTAIDPENDTVTFAQSSEPAHGQLVTFEANGAFTYRPDAGFAGSDSFKVTASDGFDSVTATIALEVRATSQALSFEQPGPQSLTVGGILSNPATGPGSGLVTYSSNNPSIATVNSAGLVTAIAEGTAEIRAEKAADDLYLAAEASYTLTVARANTAPTVTSTSFELDHDSDLPATLTAADPENDTVTFTKASDPAHGEIVVFEANGAFTYRPEAGFAGSDSFKVTASDGFDSVTATIALEVKMTNQNFNFEQSGPLVLTVGDTLSNPATGQGSGEVTYRSINEAIATVDDTGLVTAIAPGTVEILAEKAADDLYFEAEVGYLLSVVQPGDEVKVPFTAWVGEDETEVSFPAGAEGLEFYRSTAPDCDLENFNSCPDGQLDILGSEPVADTAATLGRPGYYALKDEDLVASLAINTDHFSERYAHQVVKFNGQLWLIGGFDELAVSTMGRRNDVWSSRDGITWMQRTAAAGFPARSHHQVVAFKDKLWLIGGNASGVKNDIWSSSDGVEWGLETEAAPFSPRESHQVVVHDGKLWLIGGRMSGLGAERYNDVWVSEDGVDWEQVEQTPGATFPARSSHQVVSYDGKLWLIGGFADNVSSQEENDAVWFSSDGSSWQTLDPSTGESVRGGGHRVVVFGGQLWLFGEYGSGVWSSSDGINWTQWEVPFPRREDHEVAVYDGRLWLIGGEAKRGENGIWSSRDGISWVRETPAAFPDDSEYYTEVFDGRLWLIGDDRDADIWSSSDGIDWIQMTGAAGVPSRRSADTAIFKGKLWMIGGYGNFQYRNDVWSSSDGIHWEEVQSTEKFSPRGTQLVVYNDQLWVIGGYGVTQDGSKNYLNDVWSSSDGVNWTQRTAEADFSARSSHRVVVFDDQLWLIGGFGSGKVMDDVWSSSDGVNWTSRKKHAEFPARQGHEVAVFGGKLWLVGGSTKSEELDDVWSSSNGVTWHRESVGPFSARSGHRVVVYGDYLWLIGGVDNVVGRRNDVWRSADGIDWRRGLKHRFLFH